jgi:hypothetical protein
MADEEHVEHFDDNSSYSESSDEEVAATLDIIKNRGKRKLGKIGRRSAWSESLIDDLAYMHIVCSNPLLLQKLVYENTNKKRKHSSLCERFAGNEG